MMWQDLVFLAGSALSIVFLAPTVRDATARIPLGSSVPSMTIGSVYAVTYATMGMSFSAAGSIGVAVMWSLIAFYRSPGEQTGPVNLVVFLAELYRRGRQFVTDAPAANEHAQPGHEQASD